MLTGYLTLFMKIMAPTYLSGLKIKQIIIFYNNPLGTLYTNIGYNQHQVLRFQNLNKIL